MGQMEKEGMKNQNSKGNQAAPMLVIKEENENKETED